MAEVHYYRGKLQYVWDNSIEPALFINSGDSVVYDFYPSGEAQIQPGSTLDDIINFDFNKGWPLCGPVYVNGAEPGDALEVEILDLQTRGWGWSAIFPGFGLLSEEFAEHYLRVFDFSDGKYVNFSDKIKIPLSPFLGVMGVSPAEAGEISIGAPQNFGGNMDIKDMKRGTRVMFPVQVKGALFSAGDGHACQGDGELCGTAVESPLYGVLRFRLIKNKALPSPQFITAPANPHQRAGSKGHYVTTGIDPDLLAAAKSAASSMVDYLESEHGLDRRDAYLLCSIAVDLKISELVDGNNIVSAYLPLEIFC